VRDIAFLPDVFDARLRRSESNRADAFARWHFLSGDAAGKVNQFH
jgi:hypothetical protein